MSIRLGTHFSIGNSSNRVIVVEDSAPLRQFICKALAERPNWQVICEVADGVEAVHKAKELQPDLILLNVGLPTLHGIKAARQNSRTCPRSKTILVSQESSPRVVQEELNLGALGYVLKTRAAIDLLLLWKRFLGRQFVSESLISNGSA